MLNVGSIVWLVIYLVIVTPVSLAYRLARNDPLKLKRNPAARTYWQIRRNNRFRQMSSQY